MRTIKSYLLVLTTIIGIFGCENNNTNISEGFSESEIESIVPEKVVAVEPKKVESLIPDHDKHVLIYSYNKSFSDSSLDCEIWYLNDSLVLKQGKFYYGPPIYSEYMATRFMENVNGKELYESFDSLVCETGGRSAWNKYKFKYNSTGKPIEIKHYKAWWSEGLGDKPRPDKPNYFFSETIKYEYHKNSVTERIYDDEMKLFKTIMKVNNEDSSLKMEMWDAWDMYRFKIYYNYSKHKN